MLPNLLTLNQGLSYLVECLRYFRPLGVLGAVGNRKLVGVPLGACYAPVARRRLRRRFIKRHVEPTDVQYSAFNTQRSLDEINRAIQ